MMDSQKIVPFLWFDNRAKEAVKLYTSIFENSKIINEQIVDKTGPQEDQDLYLVDFMLCGKKFSAMNAGPYLKFTPSVSLFVTCQSIEEADRVWAKLSDSSKVLMEFTEYPFSKKFGWLNDKFGLSWQIFVPNGNLDPKPGQKIKPLIMFSGEFAGKAKEAMDFYIRLFDNSKIEFEYKYDKEDSDNVDYIKHAGFILVGEEFLAMDSSIKHDFKNQGAISFLINCDTQAEIDKFYDTFAKEGESMPCGWVSDKYGVVWQVVPKILDKYMSDPDTHKADRVKQAMLKMNKLIISEFEKAYNS